MRFIKDNPALAAGIGLPVILVLLFAIAMIVPNFTVASPRHDVFFTTHKYENDSTGAASFKFAIENKRIIARPVQRTPKPPYQQSMRLYRYSPVTGNVQEILPTPAPAGEGSFVVPETANIEIVTSMLSPDGYEFSRRNERGGWFIFHSSRYNNSLALTKSGRVVRLPALVGNEYNDYSARFLGWSASAGSAQ